MKKCSEIIENISLYIDDELDSEARAEFEKHISNCETCKNELDDIMNIFDICRNTEEEELPIGFKDELHKKLLEASGQLGKKSKILFFRKSYFKLISSVAAVILLFFLIKDVYYIDFFKGSKTGNMAPQLSMSIDSAQKEKATEKSFSVQENQNVANDDVIVQSTIAGTGAASDSIGAKAENAGGVSDYTGGATTGRASNQARENQYALKAAVANESVITSKTSIVITVENPSEKLETIRNIANNNNGMEQTTVTATFTASDKETTAKVDQDSIELNFGIPNDQYDKFMNELTTGLGKENLQIGVVETEDMTAKLEDMIKKSDDLDIKINEWEKKDGSNDQKELENLKEKKRTLQSSIDSIRLGADITYVRVVVKKPSN